MTIEDSRAVDSTVRVVAQFRDRYVVRDTASDRDAVLAGRFRHTIQSTEQLPAVGDYVTIVSRGDGEGVVQISAVLPRRSAFRRKSAGDTTQPQVIAANVDLAIVATALPYDVNLRRIERYLTLAWESGATPLVLLTKADLAEDVAAAIAEVRAVAFGADVIAISTFTGEGVPELASRITPGMTAVLLGSSGVGKSTLVNALLGVDRPRTSTVRADGAGRHTTTHRELLALPNGASLIDTPGLRELQLWTADEGFDAAFEDVATLAAGCRFADCAHDTEPDCAVQAAVRSGALDPARLESWRELGRELAFLERKQDAVAAAAAKNHAKSLDRLLRGRLREKYN
jgi:ribosome biogenesis GTPase